MFISSYRKESNFMDPKKLGCLIFFLIIFSACLKVNELEKEVEPPPTELVDSDKDGVKDSDDECPDTKKETKVNEVGCPLDPVTCTSCGPYCFEAKMTTYNELENSISLTNGRVWEELVIEIPIDFDFWFFKTRFSKLFTIPENGIIINTNNIQEVVISIISPFFPTLLEDRGSVIDNMNNLINNNSLSNISFISSGDSGERVLKIQYQNAGFYDEINEKGTSNDFINFQLWLYETSNKIEIHFGPNSVKDLNETFDEAGYRMILSKSFDTNEFEFVETILLRGNPFSPTCNFLENYIFQDEDDFFIDSIPPSGTVYSFLPQ